MRIRGLKILKFDDIENIENIENIELEARPTREGERDPEENIAKGTTDLRVEFILPK